MYTGVNEYIDPSYGDFAIYVSTFVEKEMNAPMDGMNNLMLTLLNKIYTLVYTECRLYTRQNTVEGVLDISDCDMYWDKWFKGDISIVEMMQNMKVVAEPHKYSREERLRNIPSCLKSRNKLIPDIRCDDIQEIPPELLQEAALPATKEEEDEDWLHAAENGDLTPRSAKKQEARENLEKMRKNNNEIVYRLRQTSVQFCLVLGVLARWINMLWDRFDEMESEDAFMHSFAEDIHENNVAIPEKERQNRIARKMQEYPGMQMEILQEQIKARLDETLKYMEEVANKADTRPETQRMAVRYWRPTIEWGRAVSKAIFDEKQGYVALLQGKYKQRFENIVTSCTAHVISGMEKRKDFTRQIFKNIPDVQMIMAKKQSTEETIFHIPNEGTWRRELHQTAYILAYMYGWWMFSGDTCMYWDKLKQLQLYQNTNTNSLKLKLKLSKSEKTEDDDEIMLFLLSKVAVVGCIAMDEMDTRATENGTQRQIAGKFKEKYLKNHFHQMKSELQIPEKNIDNLKKEGIRKYKCSSIPALLKLECFVHFRDWTDYHMEQQRKGTPEATILMWYARIKCMHFCVVMGILGSWTTYTLSAYLTTRRFPGSHVVYSMGVLNSIQGLHKKEADQIKESFLSTMSELSDYQGDDAHIQRMLGDTLIFAERVYHEIFVRENSYYDIVQKLHLGTDTSVSLDVSCFSE